MMLLESGDDVIAIDCGLMFPDDELPGIDYVIPDFSYLLAKREACRGVILTHGHEDHIGALPYLLRELDVPVYGTRIALALAAERLKEHDLLEQARLIPVEPRRAFDLGPFRVEPIRVTHSVVDGVGYAIETPVGTVFHSGDFKFDPSPIDDERSDYHRMAELGERGVLCLMADSTNVDRPGATPSEREVGGTSPSASARRPGGSSWPRSPPTSTGSSRCWTWPTPSAAGSRCWAAAWRPTSGSRASWATSGSRRAACCRSRTWRRCRRIAR